MVKRIGGSRRKTRYKLQRNPRQKGKLSLKKFLTEFKPGDRVLLKPDSIYQKGMFDFKFVGKVGLVGDRVGECYEVSIREKSKSKTLIVHPMHMTRC